LPPNRGFFACAFVPFFLLYFFHALAPEASPDGAGYHLSLVAQYLHAHGFVRITDNFYAAFPAAVEMLFLHAFAFGQHSAAALVHLGFLVALTWQIYRRSPAAALLVFASPVVGIDAASAYNDVALAAIAFTLFHLLECWQESRSPRLLTAIGLLAGFAVATKFTAWLALPWAVGWIALKSRRGAVIVAALASFVIAPWLIKNWLWLDNPVAPFFNRLFPNPYVLASFEDTYRRTLSLYHLHSRWQIPWEVTTRGTLSGMLGPVFLLAPIALLALRTSQGRRILLAALVFGANYFSNIGTRFLIAPLPFVALAMALALEAVPRLPLAIALIHAVLSWPALIPKYASPYSWHLTKIPWREALRIKPEGPYIATRLPYYAIDRLIEDKTPPGSTVFTFTPIPEASNSRPPKTRSPAPSSGPRSCPSTPPPGDCAGPSRASPFTASAWCRPTLARTFGPSTNSAFSMAPANSPARLSGVSARIRIPGACRAPSTTRLSRSGCVAKPSAPANSSKPSSIATRPPTASLSNPPRTNHPFASNSKASTRPAAGSRSPPLPRSPTPHALLASVAPPPKKPNAAATTTS
jgi:hypothetical protein